MLKNYDAIVIGSGSGMLIVDEFLAHGLKVALVDKGPLGGTCPNLGCIPSKMLIFPADRIVEIQEAAKLGIAAKITSIDFPAIMGRMRKSVRGNQRHMEQAISQLDNLDFYKGEGRFSGDYTVSVNGEEIRGEKVFIACGSRPFIPPIRGLEDSGYLTNETVLGLKERPESVIIIGGGYIGVEYGHFLAATGVRVTILEMADRLVLAEEAEVSALLEKALSRRLDIFLNTQAEEVRKTDSGVKVTVRDIKIDARREIAARELMVAVGRRSNADLLQLENSGVETDKLGFVKVNEYLETSRKNIFAVGDANGQQMFTHVANREAAIAANNALHDDKVKMDYSAVPHAVYSHPQIASVGLSEEAARAGHDVLVGRAKYADVAKGEAMMESEGFAKAIVARDDRRILGFHIIGPYAPILIQEVVNAMQSGGHWDEINGGIHIHPALSELVPLVLNSLEGS
ncbi:MAG: dihydrolipoyl dehydrogenase [Dehalococcoidales bacterium]|nr:dihydrolipoyl dehydrogenase [Dehalococcoidales bacterium]